MTECWYYTPLGEGSVRCDLCPHLCRLQNGQRGICGSRRNDNGRLVSEVYGMPCALADDPIEKKPLYDFHPGTRCLSLCCAGCNLRCLHCQNHELSQAMPGAVPSRRMTPHEVVSLALRLQLPGIAYTYTEPLTYVEYVTDIAALAHANGLWNILVSAGYVNPAPLKALTPLIDAANIDLKYFSDALYRKVSGARLQPVLDTLIILHEAGVHLEITNLIIPQVNDDMQMIGQMCQWLVSQGLDDCPLHFSRFFPHYRMSHLPPTPLKTLHAAEAVARRCGMRRIYLGNI